MDHGNSIKTTRFSRPDQCPACGSLNVWYTDPKTGYFDWDNPRVATQVHCSECDATWPLRLVEIVEVA